MKMKNKIKLMLIVLFLSNTVQLFGSSNTDLIKKYSEYYDTNINKYETEFRKAKLRSCVDYINQLQSMQANFQNSGNLEGWEAANKELTRFRDKPVVTETVSSPTELKTLQESHSAKTKNMELTKNRQIISIKDKYIAKLEELKLKWTKSGDFKDAFLARDEITRINRSDIIKNANCSLGESPESGKKTISNKTASSTPSSNKPIAPTETVVHHDKSVVHPPDYRTTNSGYKKASLSRTKLSQWPSDIRATVFISSDKTRSSNRTTYSKTVESSDQRIVRINLQTSSSEMVKTDLHLLVQYYTKPSSRTSKPHCITTKNIPISYLDNKTIVIDMAPVSIESRSTSYGSYSNYDSGYKFHGCIITVIDSDNKIIYQGVTDRGLNDLAKHIDINTGNIDNLRSRYVAAREERDAAQQNRNKDWEDKGLESAANEAQERYEQAKKIYREVERAKCNPCQ